MSCNAPDYLIAAVAERTGETDFVAGVIRLLGAAPKECANETCQRTFLFQVGGAVQRQHRTKGVIYCSPQCARAEVQRQYRRRQKLK